MYISANDHGERKSRNLDSLYAACVDILHEPNGVVVESGYRVAFNGNRLVAFYCSHESRVKAGFGATAIEREAIEDYRLTA